MLLIKKLLIATLLFVGVANLTAQKPAWTDYYNRVEMFPENEYLVGFISGVNTKDDDPGKLKMQYETLAKDKLAQSIQVQIESNTSLNISNQNGKSDEEFLSKSISFSKANVAGLVTKSYYDRKKKEVFAIAYANKKELIFYYRNLIKSGIQKIKQKLNEGKEYAESGRKEPALKSYYEAMPYLTSIDEARALLLSLNRKIYIEVNIDEIVKLNQELNNEISKLVEPKNLTVAEAAYFVAYGLFLQMGEISDDLFINEFTYESTGLVSDFSDRWGQDFANALIDAGRYNLSINKSKINNLKIDGNYWIEDNMIKVSAFARKEDKLIASSKGSVKLSLLNKEGIEYMPDQIQRLISLSGFNIEVDAYPPIVKNGMSSDSPVIIRMTNNNETTTELAGFPVMIYNYDAEKILCRGITNNKGIANCFLGQILSGKEDLRVGAMIDLAEYLDINSNSAFYSTAVKQNPVVPVSFNIKIEKPEVYVSSEELIDGKPMEIKALEPIIKKILSDNGYGFVNNIEDADYKIQINSDAVSGGQYQGIYFSYLDVNLSVIEVEENQEIYKNRIYQLKGGGSNRNKASKKAYSLCEEKLIEIINDSPLIVK
jgi:hypothetical protein